MKRIAVFCGSSIGLRPVYREVAEALGRELAGRKLGLVFGGGRVGLMGVLADATMQAGGEVIGVIPSFLQQREVAHSALSELIVVESMHERKMRMHQLCDAVVALPGGFGTLDEFFELLTWRQLGLHTRSIGLLNVEGFFDPLIAQMDRMAVEGFLRAEHRASVIISQGVPDLLDRLVVPAG